MVQQEGQVMRKGPWTEHEDVQLVSYVNLYGDRRWDFIAKVSGLKRTGKSCRLRWVNYLHPDLKRDKMSPHEEHLVLQLHSKWGNRWSKIARKLPGRTDNEIKNYWRTYMRKKSREKKSTIERNFFDTAAVTAKIQLQEKEEDIEKGDYSMNDIWKDIVSSDDEAIKPFCPSTITSLIWEWDCCPDSLWDITDQEKDADMFFLPSEPFHSLFGPEDAFFTG